MRVQAHAHVHWEPKAGSQAIEYEDAFWLPASASADYCCAVADGATESSYARIWAKQLVQAICHQGLLDEAAMRAHLPLLQRRWAAYVRQRLQKQSRRAALPWYVAEKAQQGAYAAVLGLGLGKLAGAGGAGWGTWRALAVGDSCLAQVRGDNVIYLFPFSDSQQFNSRPYLLASQITPAPAPTTSNIASTSHIRTAIGEWCVGDRFFLMTDALAQWFYRGVENGAMPWQAFEDLGASNAGFDSRYGSQDSDCDDQNQNEFLSFREWITLLRADGAIRNDDVTVLRITIAATANGD